MTTTFLISGANLTRALARSTANEITKRIKIAAKRRRAAWITVQPDGTVRARYFVTSQRPSPAQLQKAVGGYIEAVDSMLRRKSPPPPFTLEAYAADDIPEDTEINLGATYWLEWPHGIRGVVTILALFDREEG